MNKYKVYFTFKSLGESADQDLFIRIWAKDEVEAEKIFRRHFSTDKLVFRKAQQI